MKMHTSYLTLFSVLFGTSTGIFLSLCFKGFWSFEIAIQILLVLVLGSVSGFLCKKGLGIIVKTNRNNENSRINIIFLFLLSILLTSFLGLQFLNQTLYFPPVKMEIKLSTENPNQLTQPQMVLNAIGIDQNIFFTANKVLSPGCTVMGEGYTSNETGECSLLFDIDVSRAGQLELDFEKGESAGMVEISLRSLKDKFDLFQTTTENFAYYIDIGPDLVSKKVRYPIIAISFTSLVGMLFVILSLLDATIFKKIASREQSKAKHWSIWGSIAIYGSFILGALLYTSGWLGNHPSTFINLESDAANIASFSAAYDHPENFERDAFLSDPANYKSYFAFHIPLIRTLAKIVGTYSSAFAVLLFPVILLQLIGYFSLGLILFKNRYLSFLFTWVLAFPVKMPVSEFFGVSLDVIPRFLFQSILPFLLIFIIKKVEQKNLWWLGALLFSASLYIHPVSGPAWIAVYFISIIFVCNGKNKISWWLNYVGSVVIAILGLIPFVLSFFGSANSDAGDMKLLQEITLERLTSQTESMGALYWRYFSTYVFENWTMILLWGISILFLGFALISIIGIGSKSLKTMTKQAGTTTLLLVSWWISILLICVVLPILDEIYVQKTGNLQLLREIRRTMRYYIPLLWITFFWVGTQILNWIETQNRPQKKRTRFYWLVLITCFSILYIMELNPNDNLAIKNEISCIKQGKLICEVPGNEKEKIEFYDEVSSIVKQNELIFPDPSPEYMKDSLIPRYYNLRSVAYTYKDGGSAGNTSIKFIENWWNITNKISPYLPTSENPLDLAVLNIAKEIESDYFIFVKTENSDFEKLDAEKIVFQNEYGIIYRIDK